MKDKQKSLDNLDFVMALSVSEQEKINGGNPDLITNEEKPPQPSSSGRPATPQSRPWPW